MKILKSCLVLLALIPLLPVIALAWVCAWLTPENQTPVVIASSAKSPQDTVRIGACRSRMVAQ